MSRQFYRYEVPGRIRTEREATPENLSDLKDLKAIEGEGEITLLDVVVQAKKDGVVLSEFDYADDADAYLQPFKEQAAQEALDRFEVDTLKTLADPQPEGLND